MADLLSMEGIFKVYPNGVRANDYVDFNLKEGEIHALVGENGAGKSTLMKILFGIEKPTEGKIYFKNKEIKIPSPTFAISKGIGMVHQHFMLVESLSIAENIVLGMEPKKGPFLDRKKAINDSLEVSKKYNFKINPELLISDISVGQKQKIEILKALYRGAKILILDEPTAVLTPQETEELFKELLILKSKGHTIVFISHKLNEVKEISDRITIMRRGRNVGTFISSEITKEEISNHMVGRELDWDLNKSKIESVEVVLNLKNICKEKNSVIKLNSISFSLRKKEILGIVGVEGNGQKEIVEGIFSVDPFSSGEILMEGIDIFGSKISKIRDMDISYIPEDRMSIGIAKNLSIKDNIISTYVLESPFSKKGILNSSFIDKWTDDKINEFDILAKSSSSIISSLSGGNIQKVVVAREFSKGSKIIIADQPTRGIDIGSAKFIHRKLIELRDKGASILLASADLNELLDLSDSIIVMYEGNIVAYFEDVSLVSESELGLYMLGIKKQSQSEIDRCYYG